MSAPNTDWRAAWVVYAGGVVAGAHIGKVPPALPMLRDGLGLSLVESGLIATMLNVMGMITGVLAGVVCDRFGHRRLAVAGLATMAAGGFLGAAAWGFVPLLVARFLEGVGFILITVSGSALMAACAAGARDRARTLALWSTYMPTGGFLALLAAPWVMRTLDWRGLWALLACAALAGSIAMARAGPTSPFGAVRSIQLMLDALRARGNLVMSLLFALYVAQWTSVMVWVPTYAIGERGASPAVAAVLAAAMVLVNVPGNLAGGWLIAHGVSRGRTVIAGSVVGALCTAAMLSVALPDVVRIACLLAFSASAGVIPAVIFSGLPVHAPTPQHIGTGNGMVMQASQAGQFLGPIALAWVASHLGGWQATLWPMLAFAAGAAACGALLGSIERRPRT